MSYKATHWAWELDLKTIDKFVLVALADMADEEQSCYPGQKTLARMVGASETTVRRSVSRLSDMGLLTREERRKKGGYKTSDRYFLQVGVALDSHRSNRPVGADLTGHPGPISPVIQSDLTGQSDRYIEEEPPENTQRESPDLLSPDESDDGVLIPAEWRPNQGHIDKAASLRLDVGNEYRRFRDHAERTHRRLKSWNAGFTNWLRKQAEFAQQRQGRPALGLRTFAQQKQDNNLALLAEYREGDAGGEVTSGRAGHLRAIDPGA